MLTKTCNTCKFSLPVECFTKHPQSADRLQPKCKKCRREYDLKRYETQRDEIIARAAAWNERNKERVLSAGRKVDKKRRGSEARRQASRRFYGLRGRRVRQATPPWADMSDIAQVYEVAEVLSRGGVKFHVDHEIPLRGSKVSGLHVAENLRVIPALQNIRKSNKFNI